MQGLVIGAGEAGKTQQDAGAGDRRPGGDRDQCGAWPGMRRRAVHRCTDA